ncbi:levansucrase [Devosia insulae DS-56]|uniref:Levansucrase n=1 Tax=Devosia insulae DS-56 TaxID=1116389 RepID=A0A1E5XUK7_9HYPH|nr:levansucrase [Devosia insulae]OEO32297.1 levansucrase [Devosia insulae DS-56]
MVIALEKNWIWDSWYVNDGQRWHGFFLQADKRLGDPDLRHLNVTQGHAVSDNLVDWQHLGTTFAPSTGPAWDDYTTWTGSVVRGDDQLWYLFYTGTRRSEQALYQRVGHATSTDLHNWQRVGTGFCLDLEGPAAAQYEVEHAIGHWHDRAMRDPWVMRDPRGEGWLMYFTARVPGVAEPNAGGAIGFATSPDLVTWTLQPPVFSGGFGQLEVPQVFEHGGKWYCLFCTSSAHWSEAYKRFNPQSPVTGTHYLIADDPRGPWQLAPGPFLDGAEPCRRYAARIVETADGLRILGFADNGKAQFGGYVTDPDPVTVGPDGLLTVTPIRVAAE